ncbi:hypothetical protein FRX31_026500 [Thalictrum thalictroides]|uniref:Uncharacterized protein n=1 Tax=Thalictrum thalictroides TaxID=46969 RepID=A0A7J6VG84_THATH|nr:hypothetical protein FRX31_026500 [Thalictrum thalictroides]
MDNPVIEENETRSRSFRYEDYNNRRVFLRSYPLHQWEGYDHDEEGKEKVVKVSKANLGFVTLTVMAMEGMELWLETQQQNVWECVHGLDVATSYEAECLDVATSYEAECSDAVT